MNALRLSLIGLTAILIVLVTFSSARPQCGSGNTGVLGWWPEFWEAEQWGCTTEGMIDNLLEGAARLDADARVYAHDDLNKPPEPLTTLASEAASRRTLFIKTHGNSGGFDGVYYKDVSSRDTAYNELLQAGWVEDQHIYKRNGDPAPSIFVLKAGISEKIAVYVVAANEAYMEACQPNCPREYALRPILQIVGDTMGRMDGDLMRFTYMDDCVSVAVSCAGL